MAHNYENPRLPDLITQTIELWDKVINNISELQQMTGIPGLHTDINSDDQTAGVLERIQFMQEAEERSLEAFQSYDEEPA